jgi:hypothetical protein
VSLREDTLQQRDPVSSHLGRNLGSVSAIGVPTMAAVSIWLNREQIVYGGFAALSFLVVVAVGAYIAVFTQPGRAPFRSRSLLVVVALSLVAIAVGAMSMWGHNTSLRNDWGVQSAGIYLLTLTAFRPPRELILSGGFSAVFVGVLAIAQSEFVADAGPVGAIVVGAMAPVIVATITAAVFARVLLSEVYRWEREAARALGIFSEGVTEWVSRSVQQDRVTILNQEVIPLLSGIVASGTITDSDRAAAASLSKKIRTVMVAQVNRSWLDGVIEQARLRRGIAPAITTIVRDDTRLADHMTVHQRTAVRALLDALHSAPGCDPDALHLSINQNGARCTLSLSADLTEAGQPVKQLLEPYLGVVYVVFSDVLAEASPRRLTVQFSYGRG